MKKIIVLFVTVLMFLCVFPGAGMAEEQTVEVTPFDQLSIDLNHVKVGVMTGSTNEKLVRENFQSADLQSYDSTMDAVAALKSGHVDVVVTTYPTSLNVVKHNSDLKLLPDVLELQDTAIAVKKENTQLLDQLNAVITELNSDGTLEDMQKRWLKSDLSPYEQVELNVSQSGEPIRVAVDATREPFCFKDADGEVSGLDGELARRIALKLNRPVQFLDMKFAALIPALQSGKADVIISMMNATDERRQSVNFTAPYYKQKTVMLVRSEVLGEASGFAAFFTSIGNSFYKNIIQENRYLLILSGLKVTMIITVLACILGTLLGALICWMRMSGKKGFRRFAQGYISILRGIPVLVLLMIIFYVVFASVDINPVLVAVIAFGLNFAAYVSEMFRAAILSVDKGQREAGIAGGFTDFQTFIYIILPQAVKQVLPVYKGEVISLAKMTSVVGYVAVQDLTKASDIIRSRTFDAFFPLLMIAVLYFLISWLLLLLLSDLERKFDPKRMRRDTKIKEA